MRATYGDRLGIQQLIYIIIDLWTRKEKTGWHCPALHVSSVVGHSPAISGPVHLISFQPFRDKLFLPARVSLVAPRRSPKPRYCDSTLDRRLSLCTAFCSL